MRSAPLFLHVEKEGLGKRLALELPPQGKKILDETLSMMNGAGLMVAICLLAA